MRYTVLTSRTFHHRITRYLGVLVGAALVVTLGLPSVAQAQVPTAPTAAYWDANDTFTVESKHAIPTTAIGHDYWILEYDSPSASAAKIALKSKDIAKFKSIQAKGVEGKWTFRLRTLEGCTTTGMLLTGGACPDLVTPALATTDLPANAVTSATTGAIEVQDGNIDTGMYVMVKTGKTAGSWSAKANYTHGAPPMPANFNYVSRPDADTHIFSWTDASKGDQGIKSYTLRWSYGDPALLATEWEMEEGIDTGLYTLDSAQTAKLMDGKMYTFELRALGMSPLTATKAPKSDTASVMVPIGMVPTPTLPETAALLLALLLLGSGAYLLRRRQSSGLISA